ncbi:MAG: hypothetical protein WDN28_31430 [Chthoniobacter sp.]
MESCRCSLRPPSTRRRAEETATLQRTANHVAAELGALADYLGCDSFPPVFIVHRRDLAAGELVYGDLKIEQGVLVRVNLTSSDFSADALDEWLLSDTLFRHTHGMPDATAMPGCSMACSGGGRAPTTERSPPGTKQVRTGRTAAEIANFTPARLHEWFAVRKMVGDKEARAFAGSALALLASIMAGQRPPLPCRTVLAGRSRATPARGGAI